VTRRRIGRSIDYKDIMSLYEFLLFVHIAATVVWVGAGINGLVLAAGYRRDDDVDAIQRLLKDQDDLAKKLFIPSSLVVVIFGIALVIESDAWSFSYLWITLGLVGFAATFVTGLFMLKPETDRIHQQMERDGGMTPQTLLAIERLLTKARTDYVVLFLVIADMVIKPTGDDVGVLIGMALIALAGVAYIVVSLRRIDEREQPVAARA
jgi:hypothetical protein